jgi:hypothetical protein
LSACGATRQDQRLQQAQYNDTQLNHVCHHKYGFTLQLFPRPTGKLAAFRIVPSLIGKIFMSAIGCPRE